MEDKFTAREVGVLIEQLRSEFRTVSEVVLPLREDMIEVKEGLSRVEIDLRSIKDALPNTFKRISRIETKLGF